jgi:ankyrin repeat protein
MNLLEATIIGDIQKIKDLLSNGAEVDIRDKNGMTPLLLAARKGNREIVKLLLAHGADVNAQDYYLAWTPLILASALGHKEVVKLLLEYGADVDIKDQNGMTALKYAIKNGYKEIVALLKSARTKK